MNADFKHSFDTLMQYLYKSCCAFHFGLTSTETDHHHLPIQTFQHIMKHERDHLHLVYEANVSKTTKIVQSDDEKRILVCAQFAKVERCTRNDAVKMKNPQKRSLRVKLIL